MAVEAKAADFGTQRVSYGLNATIQTVLVIAVAVGLVIMGQRFGGQRDLTRSGVNTLTPRSVKLVQNLSEPVTITAIYGVTKVGDRAAEERKDKVKSLLSLYQRANSSKLSATLIDPVKDPTLVLEALRKIRELPKHKEEAAPLQKIVSDFPKLNAELTKAISDDARLIPELKSNDAQLDQSMETIARALSAIETTAAEANDALRDISARGINVLGDSVAQIEEFLSAAKSNLAGIKEFADRPQVKQRVAQAPNLSAWLDEMSVRYAKLISEIDALTAEKKETKANGIEEIERLLENARQQPVILVSTPQEAKAIPFYEVFQMSMDESRGGDDAYDFAGESAVSSAILQITQKERTAVIFVRYGGPPATRADFNPMMMQMGQMPKAPFQAMAAALEKANFIVAEWDLQKDKQPPPVESAVRTIYVVLPVAPEEQESLRQPPKMMSEEDRKLLYDTIEQSGMAVFLAAYRPSRGGMAPIAGYPHKAYLAKTWGIDVKSDFIALNFRPHPNRPGRYMADQSAALLMTQILKLSDHPITRQSQYQQMAFVMACPLALMDAKSLPPGVVSTSLVDAAVTDTVWAMNDPNARSEAAAKNDRQGFAREEGDVLPPFSLAMASSRKEEGKPDQRIVVFGSASFAADEVAQQRVPVQIGVQLVFAPLFPGNTDLFLNSLFWLSNDADRIAVGARGADVPRLSRLKAGSSTNAVAGVLVIAMPALILLIGGVVWIIRRK